MTTNARARPWQMRRVWAFEAVFGVLVVAATVWLVRESVLTAIGAFLVVEDPLQPAQAIVVLDGGVPLREQEGARLYQAGWAPRIVVTRGPARPDGVVDRAAALERLGVPARAITVVDRFPNGTRDETNILAAAIRLDSAAPVILITSPYHTRRAALAWWQTTGGHGDVILRPAWEDVFDVHGWWQRSDARLQVWHEYVGLAAYAAGLGAD